MRDRRFLLLYVVVAMTGCGGGDSPRAATKAAEGEMGEMGEMGSGSRSAVTAEKRDPPAGQPSDRLPEPPPWRFQDGITVLVADAAGHPLPGARVSHPKSSTVTDAEGRAHLGAMGYDLGMPGNDTYWKTVTVHADGYVPVSRARPWSADGVARFRLVDRGRRIAGRVLDARGRGLGGVPLELRAPGTPAIALTTDARGAFATREAPPSAATLQVSGRTFFSDPVSLTPPREDLEVVAWPVCVVRGRLRVEQGVTLPEDLVIRAEGHRGAAYVHGSSFTIWCRPGPVVLTVEGRIVATLEIAAGETVDDVTIELGPWIEAPDDS